MFQDVVCDMHILNEMTHELLMTGSDNGMIRVWDPCYSIHSHEFEAEPCMITAAYLLKDVTRTVAEKPESTVYRWVLIYALLEYCCTCNRHFTSQ